jgi:hypothetical protein
MMLLRPLAFATLFAVSASGALGGGSSQPFDYQPDPGLKTANRGEIESRIRRACNITQAKLQGTSTAAVNGPCGCYASRTLRALDDGELEAYRATGYFNDSARAKAIGAIDACKLKRPV